MRISRRLFVSCRQYLRRHPVWSALFALALCYLLGHALYIAVLPEAAWLDRGWLAMHNGRYPEAEECFLTALAKDPRDPLPHAALVTMYKHESTLTPPIIAHFHLLHKLPLIGGYAQSVDEQWVMKRMRRLPGLASIHALFIKERFSQPSVLETLFDNYWLTYPRQVHAMIAAMRAVDQQQYAQAWAAFTRLQQKSPNENRAFLATAPLLNDYYVQAAWHTGHYREAEAAIHNLQAVMGDPAADHDLLSNLRLGTTRAVSARTWLVREGRLCEGTCPLAPENTYALALVPGRQKVRLLASRLTRPPGQAIAQYCWTWTGQDWKDAPAEQDFLNAHFADPLDGNTERWPYLDRAWGTWSPEADYLALRKTNTTGGLSLLFRHDARGVERISGHSPFEILWCNGDLWLHEEMGFTRLAPDGACTEFRGNTATREGGFLADSESLPPLPLELSTDWRLAKDGHEHLWLVNWGTKGLVLRAAWTGATFRKATPAEQQAAAPGILDAGGRLWFPRELPPGFQRDAWRHVRGMPVESDEASYAVDAKQHVWLSCYGVIARWDGHWVSVADHLPGFNIAALAIVAAGDGVLVVLGDGRVCYLTCLLHAGTGTNPYFTGTH